MTHYTHYTHYLTCKVSIKTACECLRPAMIDSSPSPDDRHQPVVPSAAAFRLQRITIAGESTPLVSKTKFLADQDLHAVLFL